MIEAPVPFAQTEASLRPTVTCVQIDLNVRVRGNGTFAGLEDVEGPLAVDDAVEVFEPESEVVARGTVTEIDAAKSLVYLSVDWATLHEGIPQRHRVEDARMGHVPALHGSAVNDAWGFFP